MPQTPKCYLAAPFFNPEQIGLVTKLEITIDRAGWRFFSPRMGENAQEMNSCFEKLRQWAAVCEAIETLRVLHKEFDKPPKPAVPDHALKHRVFNDNWMNIDDSDLLLAVIDDFDVGVMWEVGYAFARHVPIVTMTNKDYGCNLMLAHSIVGHTKSSSAVEDILRIGNPALALGHKLPEYGAAIAEIQQKYKSDFSLKEGPDERAQ